MKTRNLLIIAFLSVFMIGTASCNAQNHRLESIIRELNKEMPISMGMVGNLTKIDVKNSTLEITATVDESLVNIESLQSNPELMKKNLKLIIQNSDGDMKTAFEEMKKSDLGLKFTYVGNDSGKKASVSLQQNELKALSFASKDPNKLLQSQIELTNAQLPMDLGSGMVNTKLVRQGDYVIYYYKCDEDLLDIEQMQANIPLMQNLIVDELNNNNDPTFNMFKKMCKDANVGIGYYYVGDKSGKIAKVLIPVKDLK